MNGGGGVRRPTGLGLASTCGGRGPRERGWRVGVAVAVGMGAAVMSTAEHWVQDCRSGRGWLSTAGQAGAAGLLRLASACSQARQRAETWQAGSNSSSNR